MKQVKVFFLGALLVSFLAMSAFAAPLSVNHGAANTPFTIAYETLGTSRSVNINVGTATTGTGVSINTVSLGFTLSQNISAASLLNLQLAGGLGFQAVPYNVCAPNTAGTAGVAGANVVENSTTVGTATPTLNATTLSVLISPNGTPAAANMTAGNTIFITSNPCSGGANNSIFPVNIIANSSVGFGTVTGNITVSGTAIDTPAARNMVQIASEFVPAFTANDIVRIDYLHSPFNGTTLDTTLANAASNVIAFGLNKPSVTLATAPIGAAAFHFRTNATGTPVQSAANNAGLSVNQILSLGDSNNWVGINKVYTTNGNGCLAGNTVTANVTTLSGNIALAPNAVGGAFNGSVANNTTLCIQADGTTTLARRQFVGNYSFLMPSGGIAPIGATGVVFQTWVPNGYQAFNPYMYVGASTTADNVFNRFYNNDTRTAKVYVEVFPADGTVSQNFQLADIPPNTAGLYWGSDIGALAGLHVGTSFAAQFTVTAAPDKVNGNALFKRTTGDRELKLYKAVNGAGQFLSE